MDTYELTKTQGKYKSMKDNITNMVNALSNGEVIDNITSAQNSLKENYIVNDSTVKYEKLKKQKERVSESIKILKNILTETNSSLDSIKEDIKTAEESEEK